MSTIVTNPRTGERFVQTADRDWTRALDAWRADARAWGKRMLPIGNRAAKRGTWTLYNAAKRASYAHRLPCPMPQGHIMFEGPYFVVDGAP